MWVTDCPEPMVWGRSFPLAQTDAVDEREAASAKAHDPTIIVAVLWEKFRRNPGGPKAFPATAGISCLLGLRAPVAWV